MFRHRLSIKIPLAILLLLAAAAVAGEPLRVAVSVPPQGWLVEQVGASRLAVEVLLPPGQSPETYMPTDAEVTRMMRSAVFFVTGVPFEHGPWFEALGRLPGMQVIDLRAGIELRGGDPHIWLSPRLLRVQAATITRALTEVDPDGASEYAANHRRLEARLRDLDARLAERLQPFSGRTFVVFHPSWGYFAADYGVVQIAIERDGREPSDREMTRLLSAARAAKVTRVFVSPQVTSRGARAVAEDLGVPVETLDPLAEDIEVNLLATAGKLVEAFGKEPIDD